MFLMQGSLPTIMSQVANLANLRHVELKQNTGIKGPLADTNPNTSAGLCSLIQVRRLYQLCLISDILTIIARELSSL